jgi:hypothetical protein
MVDLQIVLLGAPSTSLASIMVVGPHHAAVTHVGSSSEVTWASGSTWFGSGSQESADLSFCVLVAISHLAPPPRRVGGWGRQCPSAGCARPAPLRRPPSRRARGRSWFGSLPSSGYVDLDHTYHMRLSCRLLASICRSAWDLAMAGNMPN